MSHRKSRFPISIGFFPFRILTLSLALCFQGCLEKDPSSPDNGGKRLGSLSVRIRVDVASPFKAIARSGDVTVTAKDMDPVTAALVIGDSTVEATVANVPTGPGRKIEAKVYDSTGTVRYQGLATADMLTEAGAAISIVLVRKTGTVTVDGAVSETDSSLPPKSTPWGVPARVSLGAQASAVLGSVLDLDEARAWTSAMANANQSGIDLVFMYYLGGFHLDNAVQAKAAGIANAVNMTNTYDNAKIKDIGLVRIAAKPADQESARKAFTGGAVIKGSVIVAGDRFLAESTEGKLKMITVISVVGTDSRGTAEVEIDPITIP
jgi:hypothetical protein